MADTQTAIPQESAEASIPIERFLERRDEDTHAEWIEGKVILMSPASRRHQELVKFLTHIIGIFAETRHLGTLIHAPFSMRLDAVPSVREPDLLFISAKHLDRLTDTYLDGPADLVVEIISPESIGRDRGEKFVEYEQAGIPEYWLIDPIREQAEFYRLERERYRLTDIQNGMFYSTVLPDFRLRVAWFWEDALPNVVGILHEMNIL